MVLVRAPEPPHTPDEAFELAEEILGLVDELPNRAWDFGQSVSEKVEDMIAAIEAAEACTAKQWEALTNMKGGVEAWLNKDR